MRMIRCQILLCSTSNTIGLVILLDLNHYRILNFYSLPLIFFLLATTYCFVDNFSLKVGGGGGRLLCSFNCGRGPVFSPIGHPNCMSNYCITGRMHLFGKPNNALVASAAQLCNCFVCNMQHADWRTRVGESALLAAILDSVMHNRRRRARRQTGSRMLEIETCTLKCYYVTWAHYPLFVGQTYWRKRDE